MDDARFARSFKIVNHDLDAIRLERFLDELNVQRVFLIRVLRLLVLERDVQRHLIRLVHDRAMARYHDFLRPPWTTFERKGRAVAAKEGPG